MSKTFVIAQERRPQAIKIQHVQSQVMLSQWNQCETLLMTVLLPRMCLKLWLITINEVILISQLTV